LVTKSTMKVVLFSFTAVQKKKENHKDLPSLLFDYNYYFSSFFFIPSSKDCISFMSFSIFEISFENSSICCISFKAFN